MNQSTTPSLSLTIWPRWVSRQFLSLPIVETLLLVTFGYSLSYFGYSCRYETIEEIKEAVTKVIDTLTQEDFHGALLEVVGTVQQVHCSRRRLPPRGLEFQVCTINKSAHTKNVWKLIVWTSYIYIEREGDRERERELTTENIQKSIAAILLSLFVQQILTLHIFFSIQNYNLFSESFNILFYLKRI